MTIDNRDVAVVEAFLLGKLSGDERVYFNARLSNESFVSYLEQQKLVKEVIEDKGRLLLKEQLRSLETEYDPKIESNVIEKTIVPFYRKRKVLAAAASVLLLLTMIGLFKFSKGVTTEDVYAAYYSPYPNLVDPITKGSEEAPTAYQLYEQDNYIEAIEAFSSMEISEDQQWYLSLSYIGNGSYQKAETILQSVLSKKENLYYNPGQWYRALLYLRADQNEEGEALLQEIVSDSSHPYANKARLLLKEL